MTHFLYSDYEQQFSSVLATLSRHEIKVYQNWSSNSFKNLYLTLSLFWTWWFHCNLWYFIKLTWLWHWFVCFKCVVSCFNSGFVCFKGVVPRSAVQKVTELFVPENRIDAARSEANALPNVDITKVCVLCWSHSYF